jgi:hypothetical protein
MTDMNRAIRAAAGREIVQGDQLGEEEPPCIDFDGGARQSAIPRPEPSMSDQIRGARDAREQLAAENAEDHMHMRTPPGKETQR